MFNKNTNTDTVSEEMKNAFLSKADRRERLPEDASITLVDSFL